MKRREFITLLGGAAAWPLAARAQQPAMPVIGFLTARSSSDRGSSARISPGPEGDRLCRGRERGDRIPLGRNQYDRLPALAAELVRRQVAVIAASGGTPAALAAKAATTTIPIVFSVGDDPVRLGLVASLARPGGNVTGVNFLSGELAAKRLELLRELVPATCVLPCSSIRPMPQCRDHVARRRSGARAMGLQIQILNASTSREIDAAFATFARERPDALFVGADLFFSGRRVQLATLATHQGFPRSIRCATFRNRRADKLRSQRRGCVSSGRRLYRPHPQGREARGLAGRAVDEVRAGHQCPDRQDARPRRAADVARPRRRGDRIAVQFCCDCSQPLMARSCRSGMSALRSLMGAKRTNICLF